MHPICHEAIHAHLTNAELARAGESAALLRERPELAKFLKWIGGKAPDFHARTERPRARG